VIEEVKMPISEPRRVADPRIESGGRTSRDLQVWVGCEDCNRRRLVSADVLDALFGSEFDLVAGRAALEAELRCEICGEKHRAITFLVSIHN
jgi:hypothetical protein